MNAIRQRLNGLIGASEHIQFLRREIEYVAKKIKILDMNVLITGPSGTGKELIAKAIAKISKKKLIPVNCGAIPPELFEAELFGHKKGAFTGAISDKKGLVEEAENGILFLDEIGDLALHHQSKLLRFLQDKTFYRIGDTNNRSIKNIKIIAATNKDLPREINLGGFREDLFYRLNHRIIQTIELKKRRVDIVCLVNHFVHENKIKIDHKVKLLLYSYDFPGNVRELESLIYSSDDYEYVKNTLRKVVALPIGIDVEFISRFKSLTEFDNYIGDRIEDVLLGQEKFRQKYGQDISEKTWLDDLIHNPDAHHFFRATLFAQDIDCSKIVEAYEIMTLRLCQGLSRDNIRQLLHSDTKKNIIP
jgi:Sigma-54 interaction domain